MAVLQCESVVNELNYCHIAAHFQIERLSVASEPAAHLLVVAHI